MTELIVYFSTWKIQVIVSLITIDVILGIIAALIKKDFILSKLANFMKGPVLAYIFGFVIVQIVADIFKELKFIAPVSFVLIVITLIASIFKNLNKLGIPVPGELKK